MEIDEMESCVLEADKYVSDLSGSGLQSIMRALSKDGAWQVLAKKLKSSPRCHDEISDVRKLLDVMHEYSLTVKGLQDILKSCQLYGALRSLNTNAPAKFLSPLEDKTMIEPLDGPVKLCVNVCGSPFPHIQWYFEGCPLDGQTSLELSLEKFNIENIGEYTCKIRQRDSDEWKSSHKFILNMQDTAPRILVCEDLKDVNVKANEDLVLSYKVRGYPEPRSFRWFKENKFLIETDCPQLIIQGVDIQKSGQYYCIALNRAGWCQTKTAVVRVEETVICPEIPEVTEQPKATQGTHFDGDWLLLVFEVRCSEQVNFTCFRNNNEFKGNSNAHIILSSSNGLHRCQLMYRLSEEEMKRENWKQVKFTFAVSGTRFQGQVLSDDVIVEVKSRNVKKAPTARNKWALVIGNSIYQNMRELPGARNDIHIVKNCFKQLGFRVLIMSDLRRTAIQNAVKLLSTFMRKGDYVSFFYAGHGIHSDGKDFIIPVDITLNFGSRMQNLPFEEVDISLDECISCVWIINILQEHELALMFSIYDTCRMMKPRFQGSWQHPSQATFQTACGNSLTIYATSENYEAHEFQDRDTSLLVDTLRKFLTQKIPVQELAKEVVENFYFPGKWDERQVPKVVWDLAYPLSLADASQPKEIDISDSGVLKAWERLGSGRGRIEVKISVPNTEVVASSYWNIEPQKDGVTWVVSNCLGLTVNLAQDANSQVQEMKVNIKLSTGIEWSGMLKGSLSKTFLVPHLEDLEDRVRIEVCLTYKDEDCKKIMDLESPAISKQFFKGNYI